MVELVPIVRTTGVIEYRERNIFDKSYPVEELRTHVGMVFQKPNPFPKSIYENVTYGPKIHGIRDKKTLDEIVEKSLRGAAIWDELKDRLHDNAYGLSGGQQQRLCIARCLAIEPDVILMDEPTSALDPISTLKVEELIQELKKDFSIVIVTHNMQQAARISDKTAFFLSGKLWSIQIQTNYLRLLQISVQKIILQVALVDIVSKLRANALLTEGISYYLTVNKEVILLLILSFITSVRGYVGDLPRYLRAVRPHLKI